MVERPRKTHAAMKPVQSSDQKTNAGTAVKKGIFPRLEDSRQPGQKVFAAANAHNKLRLFLWNVNQLRFPMTKTTRQRLPEDIVTYKN